MRLPEEQESPLQINVVPMIDVIFAILTFFIMSTLFLTRSEGLPVNLPKAATAQQQASATPITVTVDATGKISLNRKPVALNALTNQVSRLINPNTEALVILNADERGNYGKVVAVMDRLREVPGVKLAIATQKR